MLLKLGEREPLQQDHMIDLIALKEGYEGGSLALSLRPEDTVEESIPFLPRVSLIVLSFPIFRDGRAFTQARSLREYYQYRGEIRALGHLLPDQAIFLKRCGFDSIEVADNVSQEVWEEQLNRFSFYYQK